jgi:hypothetical protein
MWRDRRLPEALRMIDFLDDFEQIPSSATPGTYVPDAPWRFVWHTTEVIPSNLAGARSMAQRHPNPPHLWAWPEMGWRAQSFPLSRAARSLLRGSRPTNKMRALQCEVVGFARDSPDRPDDWWEWLGVHVLRPVLDAGFDINLDHLAAVTGDDGAGVDGAVRMSWATWEAFDGVCSHANVPENAHWDIGRGRLDLIVRAARSNEMGDDMSAEDVAKIRGDIARLRERVDRHIALDYPFGTERVNRQGRQDGPGARETGPDVRWIIETTTGIRALLARNPEGMDPEEIASLIVDGMDDTLAAAVAAKLHNRFNG